MREFLVITLILLCIVGCENKTIEKDGGLVIDLKFVDESLSDEQKKTALEIVKSRATNLSKATPSISLMDNSIRLELPAEYDSVLYRKMLRLKGKFEINKTYVLPDLFEYLTKINDEVYTLNRDGKDSVNLYSLLSLNVNDENMPVYEPLLGLALTTDTSLVNKILLHQKSKGLLPKNISFRWDLLESFQNLALYAVDAEPIISRSMLHRPISIKNPIVKLKKEYFEKWKTFTAQNAGNYAAISIDNQVFSYPKIAGEVGDGSIYQPQGSFLNDKVWSYVLPTIKSDLLEHEMEIHWIKFIKPGDSPQQ